MRDLSTLPGPGHEEGRARRSEHAVAAAAAGRGRGLAPRQSEERLREGQREPPAPGPSARLLLSPLPLLQRGAAAAVAAAGLPKAAAARPAPLPGALGAGRPGRLCPRPPDGRGPRGRLGGGDPLSPEPAERLLAQRRPPFQHRLCLLLSHLLSDSDPPGSRAGPQQLEQQRRRRRRLLLAPGAAGLLLPRGLAGVALGGPRRPGPAHALGAGGGQVVLGAELRGGGLDPGRAPAQVPAQHPGAALRQLRLVGLLLRPRLAARGPPAPALLPGRDRRLSARPGLGSLLSDPGSPSASPVVRSRRRQSACDPSPAEVQLRVLRRNFGECLRQLQDVPETLAALHFQRADDSLGLGLKAVV